MMTAEGGVDIEALARERPETIRRVQIDPLLRLRTYHVRGLTGALPVAAREGAADVVRKLFELLWERDATLVEVNPLVLLDDGRVVAPGRPTSWTSEAGRAPTRWRRRSRSSCPIRRSDASSSTSSAASRDATWSRTVCSRR